jgi:hypothetical protein
VSSTKVVSVAAATSNSSVWDSLSIAAINSEGPASIMVLSGMAVSVASSFSSNWRLNRLL